MPTTSVEVGPTQSLNESEARLVHLREAIAHAAHLLPAQGPITVFIHHNTLHAFEDMPFDEAVKKGGQIFGCQPYKTEDRYRENLRRGRIRFSELQQVLEQDLGERARQPIPCFGTIHDLRLAMLQYPLRSGPTDELIWYVAEANALRRVQVEVSSAVRSRLIAETRRWVMRDLRCGTDPTRDESSSDASVDREGRGISASLTELLDRFGESTIESWDDDRWESFSLQALWRVICDGVRKLPQFTTPPIPSIRHRDLLFEATGSDPDALVHDLLIRFCAAFLDQGFARWPLPHREEGFYRSFCTLYRQPGGSPDRWLRGLAEELGRLQDQQVPPLESILESLEVLGVADSEWLEYLSSTALALRGWGGMVQQVETRGDRVGRPIPEGSLLEFLAIRLILDRHAIAATARDALDDHGPLSGLREVLRSRIPALWPPSVEQRAFLVFQLAQIFGLSPNLLHHLNAREWAFLVSEIEEFSNIERRRIFQLAFERRLTTQTLDAIALRAPKKVGRPVAPRFQVVCCLDEREESFRRHLEEIEPEVETFGAAGFFAIAMYYRSATDAHFVALCPVVVRPGHWVVEEVGNVRGKSHQFRASTRRALGAASHQFHVGSRTPAAGAILASFAGILAPFPLVGRVLFPRLTARIRRAFGWILRSPRETRLHLEREESTPRPEAGGFGFSVDEMADIGERLLRDMGLTSGFSRLFLFIGHGSNSQNNPHNSAYNCGACGGAAGGPNARALSQILNDPRVRVILSGRGLVIPEETVFVGSSHDTCDDSVIFYDLDLLPESHRAEFASAREVIIATCARNAHERCRRFMSAPLTLTFEGAMQHVEERSEDLAQTRPELGHATNAITVVGRREWTRGLFLDRRAFLASYDPSQDGPDSPILTRVLQAVFPVCAGINLEYFFSNVDNDGFGAGTKLPHNLASLLGVMDGAQSDLRTGLPWQMVEIHEPVRSLFVIETTVEAMEGIMDRNPGIGKICRNVWIQLALLHPETRQLSLFQHGAFLPYEPQVTETPRAESSVDWYRGWRDHLEFAEIGQ